MEPRIVLINGLPGSGKTTIAREMAARLDCAAHIEGDHLQHVMTVSGCVGPGESPEEESTRQLQLRWRNIAALAANFHDEGFTVLVDSLITPRLLTPFRDVLEPRPLAYIHLEPDRAVGLARDADRGDRHIGDRYDWVATQFEALRSCGVWLDTSHHTVQQTVLAAEAALADGRALLRDGARRPA